MKNEVFWSVFSFLFDAPRSGKGEDIHVHIVPSPRPPFLFRPPN